MIKSRLVWGIVMLFFGLLSNAQDQTIAFPGAEGYGKYATGGRGGRVIEVTNLKDIARNGSAVEGSLRAALNTSGNDPITIVFKVSGLIELATELKSGRSNMTIAGQTAPGDGICIKNESIKLSGENLIIRYVRFRPGDELKGQASGLNIENSKNVIVDHCSMSWAIEECMGFYDNKYTTVQWCVISEGLYNSYHAKGARGYGSQWGGQYATYHHNLFAHQQSRSPRVNGSRAHDTLALCDYRNNVIFNWGSSGAIYGGEEEIEGGSCQINWVNNYYKRGPATSGNLFAAPSYVTADNTAYGYAEWYVNGNVMDGNPNGVNDDNWKGISAGAIGGAENIRVDTEFDVSPVNTETAQQALQSVIEKAGAILPVRDAVDVRIMAELKGEISVTGKGVIDSQTEVGGWPTYNVREALPDTDGDGMPDDYESANSLNPNNAEDGKIISADGYSNLEKYINSIDGITGIKGEVLAFSTYELEVFPNPASDQITIRNSNSIVKVEIYSLIGALVKEIHSNEKVCNIQVNDMLKGTYLLKVATAKGEIYNQKIIVK